MAEIGEWRTHSFQVADSTDVTLDVQEQVARQLHEGDDFVFRHEGVSWDLTVLSVGKPDKDGSVTIVAGPRAT